MWRCEELVSGTRVFVVLRPRSLEEPFWLLWLIGRVYDRPMVAFVCRYLACRCWCDVIDDGLISL